MNEHDAIARLMTLRQLRKQWRMAFTYGVPTIFYNDRFRHMRRKVCVVVLRLRYAASPLRCAQDDKVGSAAGAGRQKRCHPEAIEGRALLAVEVWENWTAGRAKARPTFFVTLAASGERRSPRLLAALALGMTKGKARVNKEASLTEYAECA
jgi:hypothetical protein